MAMSIKEVRFFPHMKTITVEYIFKKSLNLKVFRFQKGLYKINQSILHFKERKTAQNSNNNKIRKFTQKPNQKIKEVKK